jgi:hypothetical protein
MEDQFIRKMISDHFQRRASCPFLFLDEEKIGCRARCHAATGFTLYGGPNLEIEGGVERKLLRRRQRAEQVGQTFQPYS